MHIISTIESRLHSLEEHFQSQQQNHDSRIKQLEQDFLKRENDLADKVFALESQHSAIVQHDHAVKEHGISDEDMIKIVVQEQMKKKVSEDEDTVKRKRNIIIYRASEKKVDDVIVRKADDKAFVTDLLDGIFDMKIDDSDIEKMYRLGRWEDGKTRPLLVTFKNLEMKESIMANLRKLKERPTKFQNVGIAHDLSPKERD